MQLKPEKLVLPDVADKSRSKRREAPIEAPAEDAPSDPSAPKLRLQKLLADLGVASRRQCETLIEQGRVEVNGIVRSALPVFIDPFTDRITVDGRHIAIPKPTRRSASTDQAQLEQGFSAKIYLLFHKPSRVLTASADPVGRVTVSELVDHPMVREGKARIYPVGRLEWEATGLVLLTNDGQLAHRLTHPSFGVPRVYEVLAKGIFDTQSIQELEDELNRRAQQLARRAGKRPKDRITVQRITIKDPEEYRAAMDPGANVKTILHITVPPGGANSSSFNEDMPTGPGGMPQSNRFGRDVSPAYQSGRRSAEDVRREVGLRVAPHRGMPQDFNPDAPTERDIHRSARLGDMLNSIGVKHTRLTQIGLGPLRLTDVRVGMWRPLERHEVTMLKKFASTADRKAPKK